MLNGTGKVCRDVFRNLTTSLVLIGIVVGIVDTCLAVVANILDNVFEPPLSWDLAALSSSEVSVDSMKILMSQP